MKDKDIEHQRKLFTYFSSQDWPVLKAELESYRADTVRYMSLLDVTKEEQKLEHVQYKAKLELVDMWLGLPQDNRSLLEQFKDLFVGILN